MAGGSTPKVRIAILASGGGSNAECLMTHFAQGPGSEVGEVVWVVTNRKDAGVRDHAEHWSRTLEPGRWQGGMNDEKDWQSGGTLLAAQGAEPPAVGKPWSPAPKHCRERLLIKQDQREDILEPVDAWDRESGARSPRAAPMLLDVSDDHRWAEQHEAAPLALNRFPMTIK